MAFQTWNVMMTSVLLSVVCTCALVAGSVNSIRLYGGSSDTEGVVLVNIAGEWKSLCSDKWDAVDALVACRQLGFTDGYGLIWRKGSSGERYGTTVTPTYQYPTAGNNFDCDGTEKSLLSCKYTKYSPYCLDLAGVACDVTTANYTRLLYDLTQRYRPRLSYTISTSGGNSAGRALPIERYFNRRTFSKVLITGGICDMDSRAAMLICQDHGYTNGGKVTQMPTLPNLPMLVNRLSCMDPFISSDLSSCVASYTSEGMCFDGVQYNGVECYVTARPSVIGSLAFAGVASVLILIAGSCGIHWIRRNVKTPSVPLDESRHGS